MRFLQSHYRSPTDISAASIEAAAAKLDDWLHWLDPYLNECANVPEREVAQCLVGSDFIKYLADDLNTSEALKWIEDQFKILRTLPASGSIINAFADNQLDTALRICEAFRVLGIDLDQAQSVRHLVRSNVLKDRQRNARPDVAAIIEQLLLARDEARKNKDYARADQIRDLFMAAGVIVTDTPDGAKWELSPTFDPTKLEALK